MSSPGGPEEPTRRYDAPEAPEHGPPPRAVLAELHELWVHRALLSNFVINDLKFRYIGSSIGFFWTVVNPLLELITYTFVFHIVLDVKFHASGGTVHLQRNHHALNLERCHEGRSIHLLGLHQDLQSDQVNGSFGRFR